ncbi:MAG: glycoside hydrolase family 2, partial [Bacteroidales bacterium]|nr:glycoside hydrolase family 2 [Bacteroidales bacterium]
MKRIVIILAAVLMVLPSQAAVTLKKWTMQRDGSKETYPVTVPCTVAGALNEAGVFGKDVLDQDRYFSIDKTPFDSPWIFTTKFNATPGLKHILRFNGIGYRADIWLNGTMLASADTTYGMLIVREFDITKIAKKSNVLKVKVRRAQPGDLNAGYVDWNPRPVDESMGILREVELVSTPDVQVEDVFVKPEVNTADLTKAEIIITATLVNRSGAPVQGVFTGSYEGGSFGEPVSLEAGQTKTVTVRRTIEKPRIWWTREMGRPELYNLTARFENGGKVSDVKKVRFGIRSITSTITDKGHRQFFLNGKPVLIKSAGWTDDIFQQDTQESIRKQLEFVRDMGLNCVRFEHIWGKDDAVYDLCDEM